MVLTFECRVTIISTKIWREIGSPTLSTSPRCIEAYDGHRMLFLGHLNCEIPWEKKIHSVDVAVNEPEKEFGLIGRDVTSVDHIHNVSLFDVKVLLAVKGVKAIIKLKPDAKPVFCRARKVLLAMEDQVKIELAKLQARGIIAPVNPGGAMNASPVVWQRKKDGSFRLCADFKIHVNDKIMTEDYPLPDMETLFHGLVGSKYYIKIDLSPAYYQIMLDDAAQEICVFNTTLGLLKLLRPPQGMKNASGMFQRTIENTFKGLAGTICFQDNVLVHERTKSQCEQRWRAVQDRLKEKGFTINEIKYGKVMEKIFFLGFTFSGSGIEPDDRLVNKVRKTHPPQSVKEGEQFCGLVNFYGRFISIFTSKIAPISDLRKKSEAEFQWTDKCQRAFERLKSELASKSVVQPYSPKTKVSGFLTVENGLLYNETRSYIPPRMLNIVIEPAHWYSGD